MGLEMFTVLILLFGSTTLILFCLRKHPVWRNMNDENLVNLLLRGKNETRALIFKNAHLHSCKVDVLVATAKKKFASVVTKTISGLNVFVPILLKSVNVADGLYKNLKNKRWGAEFNGLNI